MKLVKLINLTVLAMGITILAGCQMGVQKPTVIHGSRVNPGDINMKNPPIYMPQPVTTSTTEPTGFTPPVGGDKFAGWPEDAMTLKPQTVYFELDKSTVKPSEHSKLEAVVNYLKSNPTKAVRVEGNCDERGTEEYNRSLGERRALSAREYLIQSGIDPERVPTVTNGEDKPAQTGHSESAWSKNRRDDFIVLTPPRQAQ
jgi:peptidoglycan-associated lipoprotein